MSIAGLRHTGIQIGHVEFDVVFLTSYKTYTKSYGLLCGV